MSWWSGTENAISTYVPTVGSWTHVAATITGGSNLTIYANGVSVYTGVTDTIAANAGSFAVGRAGDAAGEYFAGNIDDVRVYNRALSASEIADLAAGRHTSASWTGVSNGNFEARGNWDTSVIPDPYTRVTVQSRANQPTMTGAVQLAGLTINTGALLKADGNSLTMKDSGTFTNYGTLAIKGSETVTSLTNDIQHGTVLVYGTGSYTGLPTGTSYSTLNLNDGLVGYWKLDETSGTRAVDASGWGNSGSLIGGPTISTTVAPTNFTNARSLSIDGSNDYVLLSNTLSFSNDFSTSVWLKASDFSTRIWFSSASDAGQVFVGTLGSSTALTIRLVGGGLDTFSVPAMSTGVWYHVVFERINGVLHCYVNGVESSTGGISDAHVFTMNVVGGYPFQLSYAWNGLLDDVRIYNRALSPAEVAALAAGNQPSTGLGTVTLNGALTLNGDMILNAGTLDPSASNYGISVKGSWLNNGGKYTTRNNTVTFNGTTSGLQILSGGQRFGNVTFNGSSGTWNTRDRLTASGALTITNGTLDASGSYVIRAGSWTHNGGTFTHRSNTVVLTKDSSSTLTPSSAFNILRIEDSTESGLVGYWKFDEGTNSGSILDSSGNGNNGVRRGGAGLIWTGSTLPTNIAFDNPFAMQFDGTDCVTTTNNETWSNASAFSLSVWINGRNTANSYQAILSKRNLNVGSVLALDPSGKLVFYNGSFPTGNTVLSSNTWYHVAFVHPANGNIFFYLNGAPDGSAAGGTIGEDTPLHIGSWDTCGTFPFNGLLDDVRIYNRALSANEVVNLYRGRYASGESGTATQTLATNALSAATLAIDSGYLNTGAPGMAYASTLTLSRGNGGLTLGAGAVTLSGLTLSGSTVTGGAGALNLNGNLLLSTGSLVAPSGRLWLTGDWTKNGGSFFANNGTVVLSGSNQTLSGSTTFNNFTATGAAARTLTFAATATQTIAGALILQGSAGQLLSLRSSQTGTPWKIDAQGSRTLGSLDVRDSTNIAASAMLCLSGCVNSGNNTLWSFGGGGGTGTVLGTVWNDSDGDGIRDASESSGFSGVTLTVSGTTMSGGSFVRSRPSDFAGRYAFTGATVSNPSGYTVAVDTATLPAGVIRTRFHSSGSNVLGTGGTLRVNFGYTTPSTLSGAVFVDNDGDGTRDAGDTAVFSGTVLTLSGTTGTGGSLSLFARSNALGIYAFRGLPTSATSFTLTVTPPSGVTTTSSDSRSIALGTGGQLKFADFGYLATPSSGTTGTTGGGGGGGGGTRGKTVTASRVAEAHTRIIARYRDHQRETDRIAGPAKPRSSSSASAGPSTTPEQRLANRQERKERRLQLLAERARAEQILFATVEDEPVLYADVRTDAWYAPYVSFVIEEGIAEGYKDEAGKPTGEFGVKNPVTYAEILKMAMEAAGRTPAAGAPRNPSARGSWAAGYVKAAEDAHFSVFAPSQDINTPATRGAVIQTILEVLGIPTGAKIAPPFTDVPATHRFAPAITVAAVYGLVEGDKDGAGQPLGTFRPDDPINRAEVAKIIALAAEVAGE